MSNFFNRISVAINFIPAYVQIFILLALTSFFLISIGKAIGKAYFFMTH